MSIIEQKMKNDNLLREQQIQEDNLSRQKIEGKVDESTLDQTYLVEAGAGTGKTTLMVQRILQLVLQNKAHLTEIVAITFTDKAAQELKMRLKDKLQTMVQQDPQQYQNALWDLERAPISTIHSFCTTLLKAKPIEANIDPDFEVATEYAQKQFFNNNWEEWIAHKVYAKDPFLRKILRIGIDIEKLKDISNLLLVHQESLQNAPFHTMPSYNPEIYRQRHHKWAIKFQSLQEDCKNKEDEGYKKIQSILQHDEILQTLPVQDIEKYILANIVQNATKGNQKNWYKSQSLRSFKTEYMPEYYQEILTDLKNNLRDQLFQWLQGFLKYHQYNKQYQNMFNFDDLLIYTRDLLKSNKLIRGEFQQQYKYILVDEFQDTDPLQTEILFFLAEEFPKADSWKEVSIKNGKLFIVGDPKQSIYRFRKADIEIYETVKQHLGSNHYLTITKNFRSQSNIIDWINHIFQKLIVPPDNEYKYQPEYIPLFAHKQSTMSNVHLLTYNLPEQENNAEYLKEGCEFSCLEQEVSDSGEQEDGIEREEGNSQKVAEKSKSWDEKKQDREEDLNTKQVIQQEANIIAQTIQNIFQEQWKIASTEQSIQYKDIAILLYRFSYIDIFEQTLAQYNIPYQVIGSKSYYSCLEIKSLSNLLQALEQPFNPIPVIATLRSPIFTVSDQDIFHYKFINHTLDYRVKIEDDGSYIAKIFQILYELHKKVHTYTLAQLLDEIYTKTGLPFTFQNMPRGQQRLLNLKKIQEKAYQNSHKQNENIHTFIEWLETMTLEQENEEETMLTFDDQQKISILSIHKSKGLEYPCIFLGDLVADPVSTSSLKPQLYYDANKRELAFQCSGTPFDIPKLDSIKELEKEKARTETIRLLYVATTRAKDHLFIPTIAENKTKGLFQLLKPYLADNPYHTVHVLDKIAIPKQQGMQKLPMTLEIMQERSLWMQQQKQRVYREQIVEMVDSSVLSLCQSLLSQFVYIPFPISNSMLEEKFHIYTQEHYLIPEKSQQAFQIMYTTLQSIFWKNLVQCNPKQHNVPLYFQWNQRNQEYVLDLLYNDHNAITALFYVCQQPSSDMLQYWQYVKQIYSLPIKTYIFYDLCTQIPYYV
ncbi:MAG TPA: UvrD-helicase domain-containing protein [Planctomycetota bacterium]|nr:UvrD-helicase domain-containing protein [Planctomycetota bacterium]